MRDLDAIELTESITGEAIMPRDVDPADHEPGDAAARLARVELDRLYAKRAYAYCVIGEAEGHHTGDQIRATEEASEAIDAWLAQHDAEVAAKALEDAATSVAEHVGSDYASYTVQGLRDRAARIRAGGQP